MELRVGGLGWVLDDDDLHGQRLFVLRRPVDLS